MKSVVDSPLVAVSTDRRKYPIEPPYSPDTRYPEYPFDGAPLAGEANHAYAGVRDALRLLEFDAEHFGRKEWNPLGHLIHPGDTVVLKPNFVREFRETHAGDEDCLITHGSILRAALDYVYIALEKRGRAIIADAPRSDADLEAICRIAELGAIQEFYRQEAGFEVEVYDLRPEKARKIDGVIVGHEPLPGDPAGYVKVDLGPHSMFAEVQDLCHLLYGSEYDTSEICRHHTGGVHEYLISRTILGADCVINLPKLKTHKKTGLTVCLKNLVGINGNKNWLPHHRLGTPSQGGDQFRDDGLIHRIERTTMAYFRRIFPLLGPFRAAIAKPLKVLGTKAFGDTNTDKVRSGNWYGNDTTWRMTIDLNRILMYADASGRLQEQPPRQLFCIVDGIVGGEGNGPLDPTPRQSAAIIAGTNPVVVELACARYMGFDYRRLPVLYRAIEPNDALPLTTVRYDDIACISDDWGPARPLGQFNRIAGPFKPHFGWAGHVELDLSQILGGGTCAAADGTPIETQTGYE